MATYHYNAIDINGKRHKGFVEANDRIQAFSSLQKKNLYPTKLSTIKEGGHVKVLKSFLPHGKIRLEESFYYLGMMLQGGSSLTQGLSMLGRMKGSKYGKIWLNIRDKVESGSSFSEALKEQPKHFSPAYIGMVQVSEKTGKLGAVLEKIAHYEESKREIQGKLLSSLMYPLVILLVGIGAIYFLMSKVLPNIVDVFAKTGQEIPWNTKALLFAGNIISDWSWIAFLLFGIIFIYFVFLYKYSDNFRYMFDRLIWNIPFIKKSILAKFSALLSFQIDYGIPLVQAMHNSVQGINSSYLHRNIINASQEVSEGVSMDIVLEKQRMYPDMYITAISAGIKSGQLAGFLGRLGNMMEREVDFTLRRFVSLVEPVLILALGIVIAFFVISVMSPVFDMSTNI